MRNPNSTTTPTACNQTRETIKPRRAGDPTAILGPLNHGDQWRHQLSGTGIEDTRCRSPPAQRRGALAPADYSQRITWLVIHPVVHEPNRAGNCSASRSAKVRRSYRRRSSDADDGASPRLVCHSIHDSCDDSSANVVEMDVDELSAIH